MTSDEWKVQVEPLAIDVHEVALYLRLDGHEPDTALAARIAIMRKEALRVIRPARVWRRIEWPKTDGAFGASLTS